MNTYAHTNISSNKSSITVVWIYISIAYIFSLSIRSLLYFDIQDIDSFWINSLPIPIYSPDAGLYGYYASQILSGASYPYVSEYMPGYLVAFVVKITSLKLDTVMFALPILLASLVVVPIVLIAHALHLSKIALPAAMLGSICVNYYTRSHLGYMDTDVLNVFLPWLAIAFMVLSIKKESISFALLSSLLLLAFRVWYHSSSAILAGIVLGLLIVTLLFYRKSPAAYTVLILSAIAIVPIAPYLSFVAALLASGFFVLIQKKSSFGIKPYILILAIGAIGVVASMDIAHYLSRASEYLSKSDEIVLTHGSALFYFSNVLSSVSEAVGMPIYHLNPIFVAMEFYVAVAVMGFLLLVWHHKVLLVATPLLLLGLLSEVAGMRFAMFASPALALGFVYLAYVSIDMFVQKRVLSTLLLYLFSSVGLAIMLLNITKLNKTLEPFYFKADEVRALQEFKDSSQPSDLLLSWWDFGWETWYYTGRNNTLMDNGRHGSDTFLVANELLSSSQLFVANSAKQAALIKSKRAKEVMPVMVKNGDIYEQFKKFGTQEYHIDIPNNAYYLLHFDMFKFLPTIIHIADKNPNNGNIVREREFYMSTLSRPYSPQDPVVKGSTFELDLRDGTISSNDGVSARVNSVFITENGNITAATSYDKRSPYFMIIYNNNIAFYMDGSVFYSFLIQALLLDQYDKNKFELISKSPLIKILKVK